MTTPQPKAQATPQPKAQSTTQTPKKNLFSRCWASLGKAWTDKMTPKIKKVVDYLEERSEIIYIGQAIPVLLLFILSMITSAMVVNGKYEYKICEVTSELEGKTERLYSYLLGNLILQYLFIIMYSNMVVEYYKTLATIHSNFIFFVIFMTASLVWNIYGSVQTSNTLCDQTSYHTAAMINIIIFFIAIGLMFAYAIAMMILKFLKNRKQAKEEAKPKETKISPNAITNANESKHPLTSQRDPSE